MIKNRGKSVHLEGAVVEVGALALEGPDCGAEPGLELVDLRVEIPESVRHVVQLHPALLRARLQDVKPILKLLNLQK